MLARLYRWLDRPLIIAVMRIAVAMVNVVTGFVLARALGPQGRGETAAVIAILGIAPIVLGLGLPLVVRRRSVDAAGAGRAVRSVRLLAVALTVPSLGIGLLCTATVLGTLDDAGRGAFLVGSALIPVTVLWTCDANVLFATGRNLEYAMTALVPAVVIAAVAAGGAVLGVLSVAVVVGAIIAGNVVALAFTSLRVRVSLTGGHEPVARVVREGVRFSGAQIADAASRRLDQAIALPLVGAVQAGYYSVAASLTLLPLALGSSLGAVAFRRVSAVPEGSPRKHEIARSVRGTVVLTSLVSLVLAAASPVAIRVVFGADFVPAVGPTLLALTGTTGVVLAYVASSILTALGRGWVMTAASALGGVVGIALAFVLGPRHGAMGLAAASSIGFWVSAVLCVAGLPVPRRELTLRRSDLRGSITDLVTREDRVVAR